MGDYVDHVDYPPSQVPRTPSNPPLPPDVCVEILDEIGSPACEQECRARRNADGNQ